MDARESIDWSGLALRLGARDPDGVREYGSDDQARAALVHLLGEAAIRDAVDFYVARPPGSELVRSVLWLLRPWPAMQRCHEIYASDADDEDRRAAIELLRVVADRRVLPWIPAYLADPDHGVRAWGIGVVDQLVFGNLVDIEDVAAILAIARAHDDPQVRAGASQIDEMIAMQADPA